MSDSTTPVPKGHKRCPSCQGLVKGPRTLKCPDCGHEFGKASAKPSQAKAKAVHIPKPGTVVKHRPFGDNFASVVSDTKQNVAWSNMQCRAYAITPMDRSVVTAGEYIRGIEPVSDPVYFPSMVEVA